jgi:hypothetical protein
MKSLNIARVLWPRVTLAAVLLFCLLIIGRAPASADCGMHLFETQSVKYLQSLEALPLTAVNVMHTPGNDQPELPFVALLGVNACSDEPALSNDTARALVLFWRYALAQRATLAALRINLSGGTTMPAACASYEKAAARANVADAFAFAAPRSFNADGWKPLWSSMKRSPHFAHIEAIWRENFQSAGLIYQGVTSNNTYAWSSAYGTAAHAAHDHLAAGIFCQGNASYYSTLVTNGGQSG